MKCDILLAGVGGQGIISIAMVYTYAALKSGLFFKQSEVHGMSQRGGDVQSHLRISSREIYSDMVPAGTADLVISLEPLEALRYLPFLSAQGWIITNTIPIKNMKGYPETETVLAELKKQPHCISFDAENMAKEIGNPRGMNMVIAGAASNFIDIPFENMEEGIRDIFARKGEDVVNKNLEALRAGQQHGKSFL
jgi:indolepyruvate ferredoxin oxidoreductase beta subunit